MKIAATSLLFALVPTPASAAPPTVLPVAGAPFHLTVQPGEMTRFVLDPGRPGKQTFDFHVANGNSVMSIAVEDVAEPATLDGCREVFDRRPMRIGGTLAAYRVEQHGDALMQEYDWYTTVDGRPYLQHNVFSCRVRGTFFIDVHASTLNPVPGDAAKLRALVAGVRIVD